MANAYKLWKTCPSCKGTGVMELPTGGVGGSPEITEFVCSECKGDKLVFWGWCTEAVFPLPELPGE